MPSFVISTENGARHVQTRILQGFADRLSDRLDGRYEVSVAHSAALYRGRDVVEAVAAGRVDMAAPGIWHLGRYVGDFNVFLLPMFYGRDPAAQRALVDGTVGRTLMDQLSRRLDVQTLGRWLDLGHAHLFFTAETPITDFEQISGLRMRVPGGGANALRLEAMGANVVVVPWPDLPDAMRNGEVNGALTTPMSVASASLWTAGLGHAFLDRQYFAHYVPLISERRWRRLPEDVRAIILDTWEEGVNAGRAAAADAQATALEDLRAAGISVITPEADTVSDMREQLLARQSDMVTQLGLSADLVEAAQDALEQIDSE